MLLKSKISTLELMLDPELNKPYYEAKLGKFTSSEWYHLMAKEGIGKGGMSYIYRKVGEKISGRPAKDDVFVNATEHGLNYERDGLFAFSKKMVLEGKIKEGTEMKVQKLVIDDENCGGTPDGIIILNTSQDGLYYNVRNVEIKCPVSFDGYIRAWKCKTPADLKRERPDWYWQTLHQMFICDCLDGYFVVYQPFFSKGGLNVIEFNKLAIVKETGVNGKTNDFKLIAERKKQAIEIFDNIYKELTQ